MKNRLVILLFVLILSLIGVTIAMKNIDKEVAILYCNVTPFGEKSIANKNEMNELEEIISENNVEYFRDNDFQLSGPVYLLRISKEDIILEYGFFGNTMHYVEVKDDVVLVDKWYESNEKNLSRVEKIFKSK